MHRNIFRESQFGEMVLVLQVSRPVWYQKSGDRTGIGQIGVLDTYSTQKSIEFRRRYSSTLNELEILRYSQLRIYRHRLYTSQLYSKTMYFVLNRRQSEDNVF